MNDLLTNEEAIRFAPVDETELDLCRALWASVAMQAVIDARSQSKKPEMAKIRDSARSWLQSEGEELSDFEMVCEFAGIEFTRAKESFLEIADNDEQGIDFRCLKKEAKENRGIERRSEYLKRIRKQKDMQTLH